MRGVRTRTTTAQLVGQALIAIMRGLNKWPSMDRDETTKCVAEIWDEVAHHDTYGGSSLAWVYEIRQSEIINSADSLFRGVLKYIQQRRITA